MKEYFHIKNLGPIRDVVLDDIKPFTLFVGESGSGKSTIMKALALFRWLYKMHNVKSYLKNSSVRKSPFRYRAETYFSQSGLDEYLKLGTEIKYRVYFDDKRYYEIGFKNNKLTGTGDKNLIRNDDLYHYKISFIPETRNNIPFWATKGPSLSVSGDYLGFYFQELYNDFDRASNAIQHIDLEFLKLKFEIKKQQGKKKFYIKNYSSEYSIDLKNSSSGTQNSAPVYLLIDYFANHFDFFESVNNSIFKYLTNIDRITEFNPVKNLGDFKNELFIHIEEPELSLFPDAQYDLMQSIVKKCLHDSSNKIKLMISTHSPYIVNFINLLIKRVDQGSNEIGLAFEKIDVFRVHDGFIESLKAQNERVVNTMLLSETINRIYDEYESISES